MKNNSKVFRISGYIPLDTVNIGFKLPLFSPVDRLHEGFFIQIVDEYTNTISDFAKMETKDLENAARITSNCVVAVGAPIVYAFCYANGQLWIGPLSQISGSLELFSERNGGDAGICLQIAELVGDHDAKRGARRKMMRQINNALGTHAGEDFFVQSVLRSILWERLLQSSPSQASAYRILANRRSVLIDVDKIGKIRIDLSSLDPADFSLITKDALLAEIQNEYNFATENPVGSNDIIENLESRPFDYNPHNFLGKLSIFPRQEERVAYFVKTILEDETYMCIIDAYKHDKGKFATNALHTIRQNIKSDMSAKERELRITKLLSSIFRNAIGFNRGTLLFYFAKHLHEYSLINQEIRRIIKKSNNLYVHYLRDEINAWLDEGSAKA